VALVKGDIAADGPVLVRMHAFNVLEDVLGDRHTGKAQELQRAMRIIGQEGRGIVVLIREPHRSSFRTASAPAGRSRGERIAVTRLRCRAQILLDLGVKEMTLFSNTQRTIIGLQGYGLTVTGRRPIPDDASAA